MKVYLYIDERGDLIITHQKPPITARRIYAVEYQPERKCRKRVVSTEELINAEMSALGIARALRVEREIREAAVSIIYHN